MRKVPFTYFGTAKKSQRWKEKFLGIKWLQMNEVVALKKLVRHSKTTDLRQLGIFLYKV